MSTDQMMTVTYWTTRGVKNPTAVRSMTLHDLVDEAVATEYSVKADLPWIKLATYGDKRSDSGARRWEGNIDAISGVECDYDAGVMPMSEAVAKLNAAGVMFGAYTSFSHTTATPKYRILCAVSTAMPIARRAALVARVNGVLGGGLADESFVPAQGFYLGHREGATDDEFYVSKGGRFIDLCEDLEAGSIGLPPPTARESRMDELSRVPSTDAALELLRLGVDEVASTAGTNVKYKTLLRVTWRLAGWINGGLLDHDDAQTAVYEAIEAAGAERMEPVYAQWERAIERAAPLEPHTGDELGAIDDNDPMFAEQTMAEVLASRGGRPRMIDRIRRPSQIGNEPARPYIVKKLIRPGDVCAIVGPPGAGKSMLAPLIGYKIAQGKDVFGMRSNPGFVLYMAAEDVDGMGQRIKALEREHGTTDNFGLVDISNLRGGDEVLDLLATVRELKPTLVIIDTLGAAFAGMAENSPEDMGKVVELARHIAATGACCMVVHHTTKANDGTARGHSVLQGTLDMLILLDDKTPDGIVRCTVGKNRAGPSDLDIAFTQRSVTLGHDEDGDTITAPMAVELAARPFAVRKPLAQSLKAPLRILTDLVTASGKVPVTFKDWRAACEASGEMGVASGFRTQLTRAKDRLIELKIIAIKDSNVSLIQASGLSLGELAATSACDMPLHSNTSVGLKESEYLQYVN